MVMEKRSEQAEQMRNAMQEIDDLHTACHELQNKKQELQQRIECMQKEISKHIAAAAQWEARFDRLLRYASGPSN